MGVKRITAIAGGTLLLAAVAAYAGADLGLAALDDAERERLARSGEAEHFVSLPDGVIHYREAGPRGGAPVVLIHGFSSPGSVWAAYVEALSAEGFRVIAPDLFGRGYSERPAGPYDGGLFEREIGGLLAALDLGSAHLVGKSMGGAVATVFAAAHPGAIETLTLIAPATLDEHNRPSPYVTAPVLGDWIFTVLGRRIFSERSEAIAQSSLDPDGYRRAFQAQIAYPGYPQALLSSTRHLMISDFGPARDAIGRADYPTLAIWGSDDVVVPPYHAEDLIARVPRTRLNTFHGATHAVERERFDAVLALLVAQVRTGG